MGGAPNLSPPSFSRSCSPHKRTHLRRHWVGPPAPLPPDEADDALDARHGDRAAVSAAAEAAAAPAPAPPPSGPPGGRGWEARWTQPALRTRSVVLEVVVGGAGSALAVRLLWCVYACVGGACACVREEGEGMERESAARGSDSLSRPPF